MKNLQFVCMVGLPGSGKSVRAARYAANGFVVVETDVIRQMLYGSEQGDSSVVFKNALVLINKYLGEGMSVVLDATNISYKHRISLLRGIKHSCIKIAHVMATEISICIDNNSKRSRVVPTYVIMNMWKRFTVPQYSEGWGSIKIDFNYHSELYRATDLAESMKISQDNPHHNESLYEHSRRVASRFAKVEDRGLLYWAGFFHDIGKIYTKQFVNSRGEKDDIAHYFGHEHVGAYEAMFYARNLLYTYGDIIYICGLIQYHMRLYGANSEKAREKLRNLVGNRMFNDLGLLHEADCERVENIDDKKGIK